MSESRVSESQTRALSALRSVAPADVAAHAALWESDPALSIRLRDAVVAALAGTPEGPEAVGVAVLSVARHYGTTGDATHAVARACRLARQTVRAALSVTTGPLSIDGCDSTREAALARPAMGRGPEAIVVGGPEGSLSDRVADALAALPDAVRAAWAAIGAAWLAHDADVCARCETGRRPTLATVRAHAAGHASKGADWQRSCRADRATVTAVSAALATVRDMPERPDMSGPAWALIRALRDARLSGRSIPTGARIRYDVPGVRVETVAPYAVTLPGPVGPIPAARADRMAARAALAWADREAARQGRALARQEGPHPAWTHGPMAGPAPLPGPGPESGRYVGETVRGMARSRGFVPMGPARRPVVESALPETVPGPAPAGDVVTVRAADGTVRVRALSEAERAAMGPARETVEIAGETVPVVRAPFPGESGRDRSGTAPHGAGWRREVRPGEAVRDAQVLSGKRPVSPRKRAGAGSTGPTVPDNGPLR